MKEIIDPFEEGKPVHGDLFFGRKDEIDELLRNLSNFNSGQSFAIIGKRRIGKTSLLLEVMDRLEKNPKVVLVYVDIEGVIPKNFKEFLIKYSKTVNLEVARKINNKIYQKLVEFLSEQYQNLSKKIPKIESANINTQGVELSLALRNKTFELDSEITDQILNLAQDYAKKTKRKIVIMLDEFQFIQNFDEEEIEGVLRSSFQHMPNVSLVVSGSEESIMKEMLGDKKRPFFNFFRTIEVKEFGFYETEEFLEKTFKKAGLKITKEAILKSHNHTLGNPFYLQLLGKEIISNISKVKSFEVDENIVKDSFVKMLGKRNLHLEMEMSKLTSKEKDILISMSFMDFLESKNYGIISNLADTTEDNVKTSLGRIEKKGIVQRTVRGYLFSDKVFQRYVFISYFLKKIMPFSSLDETFNKLADKMLLQYLPEK